MKYTVLVGRILFSLIFINSGTFHFTQTAVDYAVAQGVPLASFLVPVSGIMAIIGGLLVLVGYKTKWGAWLLVAFLVPVTFMMHPFWKIGDDAQQQVQMAMFMKNISMLGAALYITWFGGGPMSFDNRRRIRGKSERND